MDNLKSGGQMVEATTRSYELTEGSNAPVYFEPELIEPVTDSEAKTFAEDPENAGLKLVGWYRISDGQPNCHVVAFDYAKVKDGEPESNSRVMIITGKGKGVFNDGHAGQWPADYIVGPQIGEIQYDDNGEGKAEYVSSEIINPKNFSLGRVYGRKTVFTL